MADGEARLDISGDSKEAEAALGKLTKALAKSREETRQLNEKFKDMKASGDGTLKSTSLLGDGLSGLVTRIGGVTAIAGAAVAMYRDWSDQTQKLTAAHRELSAQFVKAAADSGKLTQSPQIAAWLKTVTPKGVTPGQGIQALSGIMQAQPTLGDKRQMDIAAEIGKLAPTGVNLEQTGGLAADVAAIVGDKTSAADVADLAMSVKRQVGDKAAAFSSDAFQRAMGQLQAKGMNPLDVMAHAIAALQSDQRGDALGELAAGTKGLRGKPLREMLAKQQQIFDPKRLAAIKSELAGDDAANLAEQQVAALNLTPYGRTELLKQMTLVAKSQKEQLYGPKTSERQAAREFIDAQAYGPGIGGILKRAGSAWAGATSRLNEAMGFDPEAQTRNMTPEQRARYSKAWGGTTATEVDLRTAEKMGLIPAGQADKFIATLEKNTTALEKNTAATKANTPGPKANIDAHNE